MMKDKNGHLTNVGYILVSVITTIITTVILKLIEIYLLN